VARPFEHHVLEKMREAAAPSWFEAETDFVVHPYGDDRRRGIRRNDHVETVG
jgi:hypothetical protein